MASIQLKKVCLEFPVYDSSKSFRKALFKSTVGGGINSNKGVTSVVALKDVCLQLNKGDRLGLVGHNGAGKSTLLRVIAGLYPKSSGDISISGKVTGLFTTSLGMDIDDTGYENILNIGLFLGMTKKDIAAKREEIADFSELKGFLGLPIRTYSDGMKMRLAFSIATSIQPEILLLDEGIGAGDARFSQKANERVGKLVNNASILVLASHADSLIRDMCTKAILLEHGQIKAFGAVDEVLNIYHNGK